jgi:hypothetical protein
VVAGYTALERLLAHVEDGALQVLALMTARRGRAAENTFFKLPGRLEYSEPARMTASSHPPLPMRFWNA